MNGFLLIDKPQGISSFAVIRKARAFLFTRKIGHSGTLDPEATGLLVLGIGTATRLLPYLPQEPKEYFFSIQFGSTTDTLDKEGKTTDANKPIPKESAIKKILNDFIGKIEQEPPLFSAIKIKGTPAYEYARREIPISIEKRFVTIYSLVLHTYDNASGVALCSLQCSKGTYVRALCRDIAHKLGTVAYASSIRRTKIGNLSVDQAISLQTLSNEPKKHLISIPDLTASYFSRFYPDEICQTKIKNGASFNVDEEISDQQTLFIFNKENSLLAIAERETGNRFHPVRVFM